jgi:GAF domain-containing protein
MAVQVLNSYEFSTGATELLEDATPELVSILLTQAQQQAEQQRTLTRVISRIRESLDLGTIFQTTAIEVRELLQADRVAVFQFDPAKDWQGEFISEAIDPKYPSALAAKVQDHCFGPQYAAFYEAGRMQIVSDIYEAGLSDCHVQILSQFQVRANLIVPLLKESKLWGLICVHQCDRPREWNESEIEFVSQIAENLNVALHHNKLLEDANYQTEQQKALTSVIGRIRESLDLTQIFNTTAREVRQLLKADRVGIFKFKGNGNFDDGTFIAEDVEAGFSSAIAVPVYDHCFGDIFVEKYANGGHQSVSDIQDAGLSDCHRQILERFEVRANLVLPVRLGETLWGLLCIHQCATARDWKASEIEFVRQIADQLGVALRQDVVLQQVQTQAAELAQAKERSASMDRQKLLTATIEKIRTSLDLSIVFKSTTEAVRDLLEVERVAIYRFNGDWSGKFVADSMKDGWSTLSIANLSPAAFSIANGEGEFPRNETFVPIPQGDKLWGLLVAYQNSQPRYWHEEEVNLLAQVGVQLGVAIQQAELLAQTQKQTQQLQKTIAELQQTQTQLIQGEKMASLGQLVAGIAHEINNPVNFIYGNLKHVEDYAQDLMKTIEIYKIQQPETTPIMAAAQDEMDIDFIMEDLPKTISSMKIGADRIREIVLSLRNFSRSDEADFKPVDLHEGLESTLLILGHRFKAEGNKKTINLIKQYGVIPPVECYPAQLNQVFMNILANAIDALEEVMAVQSDFSPEMTIATTVINASSAKASQVQIKIMDNGMGMSEEVRSRIFDPFFTTKEPGKGTGLGLPICYQIIHDKHQGSLVCESQPGQGTRFIITIPLKVIV